MPPRTDGGWRTQRTGPGCDRHGQLAGWMSVSLTWCCACERRMQLMAARCVARCEICPSAARIDRISNALEDRTQKSLPLPIRAPPPGGYILLPVCQLVCSPPLRFLVCPAMSDPALSDQSPSVQLKQFAAKSPAPAYVVDLGAPDSAHVSDSHVWWKMDLYILPVATLIFFLSFLVSPSFIAVLRHTL